ncbi:GTP-binding protein [Helicobacter aurati]|uniref:GTP-binding protein n=1 Tax=Helicobacter aurati TaxID=137778 RepID=A0A3D8IWY2_9HELI|nr:GTP-binding protein [Helicobacter aurati]RDU69762.1 GTP-binding protein [Helicobacter aurati]
MAKIPVHIITGFLGSGKTTFLREILQNQKDSNIALVVNELGEIGLDNILIDSEFIEEKTVVISSGCMCCHKREDLSEKFKELLNRYEQNGQKLDRILIETTGLASPAPILFTFLSDAFLSNHFEVANIITCIDSLNGLSQIQNNEEALSQIIHSDCIVFTKVDLNADIESLGHYIHSLHYGIKLIRKELFSFENLLEIKHEVSDTNQTTTTPHKDSIHSLCLYFEEVIDWSAFSIWLSMLLHRYGSQILRIKGLVDIGEEYLIHINGVGHLVHPPTHIKDLKKEKRSKLVFIAKNLELNLIEESLKRFLALAPSNF